MVRKYIISAILVILAGCSVGKKVSPTFPTATVGNVPLTTGLPASTPAPSISNNAVTISITGTVQDTMLSARVILLREPVQGFQYLALEQNAKLVSADGTSITLIRVRPGMRVKATGQPGASGALLTVELNVLP